jgi:hypothetical protein
MKFPFKPTSLRVVALAAAGALLTAGCASTVVDASWRDAQLSPSYLRGGKVLVMCETQELVLKRICQDQTGADLQARGVAVVYPPDALQVPTAPSEIDPRVLQAARSTGATAVFGVTIAVSAQAVSQGMSISIGGFGFGGGGGGAGVGVSAPIGGGQVSTGYTASGRVTDVASGRLMWTARATAPPSSDVNAQMAELAKVVIGEAQKAGLF